MLLPPHLVNLFDTCPYVDTILPEPRGKRALYHLIRQGHYDTAIMMRRTLTQTALASLAGVSNLIGYDMQRFIAPILPYMRRGWFLDAAIPFPPVDTDIPQVLTYLRLAEPLGIVNADPTLALWPTPEDSQALAHLVQANEFICSGPWPCFMAAVRRVKNK